MHLMHNNIYLYIHIHYIQKAISLIPRTLLYDIKHS